MLIRLMQDYHLTSQHVILACTFQPVQRMVAGKLFLQICNTIHPVALRNAHIPMAGHVLHLAKVVVADPVDDHALAYLAGIMKLRVILFQAIKQMMHRAFQPQ